MSHVLGSGEEDSEPEWTRFACWRCAREWNEDGFVDYGTCPNCGWDTRDREGLDSPCVS